MSIALTIAGVCLLLEAFFSSAEIAIVSADKAHIRRLAQSGHRGARYVEDFLVAPHRLLATTLLGTHLSLVTSTVVMTLWLYRVAPQHAELYLLLGLTPVVVTFGEIVPKAIVRQHANRLAPLMALLLHGAMQALAPLVTLLARLSALVARRLGIEVHRKLVTREEIEGLIAARPQLGPDAEMGMAPSDVTEGERSMISRIFDFSSVEVYRLMVPLSDVCALPETATVAELAREIADKKYSRIPIYRERVDQIVGVVHAFDVLKAAREARTAAELMRPPVFVPESSKAVDLLGRLQRTRQGMAVVVDEYGGAVGVVTVEDILEEIVGEIDDEYDVAPPAIQRDRDGSYCIQARTSIAQINQELGLQLPESEDYESLAGLMLEHLRHIPRVGEVVRIGPVVLTVTAATDRRIEQVRLRIGRRR
ncbi:MAG: hemolysin family protein [Myxococcales bacterium]|nr:hemolysin family protein [Myxococcota bacterium]MDW8284278.1 hemolysin family protein [Myxococcales bacterium]